MTKLELLNTFLNDRLTAAAEEIFRAVKETVQEYQSEILRSKEENERLQRLLNVTVQRLLLQQPGEERLRLTVNPKAEASVIFISVLSDLCEEITTVTSHPATTSSLFFRLVVPPQTLKLNGNKAIS